MNLQVGSFLFTTNEASLLVNMSVDMYEVEILEFLVRALAQIRLYILQFARHQNSLIIKSLNNIMNHIQSKASPT